MTAGLDHALADERHAARYGIHRTPARATARRTRGTGSARERLGVLLVEAGLHLMTRAERRPTRFARPGAAR